MWLHSNWESRPERRREPQGSGSGPVGRPAFPSRPGPSRPAGTERNPREARERLRGAPSRRPLPAGAQNGATSPSPSRGPRRAPCFTPFARRQPPRSRPAPPSRGEDAEAAGMENEVTRGAGRLRAASSSWVVVKPRSPRLPPESPHQRGPRSPCPTCTRRGGGQRASPESAEASCAPSAKMPPAPSRRRGPELTKPRSPRPAPARPATRRARAAARQREAWGRSGGGGGGDLCGQGLDAWAQPSRRKECGGVSQD